MYYVVAVFIRICRRGPIFNAGMLVNELYSNICLLEGNCCCMRVRNHNWDLFCRLGHPPNNSIVSFLPEACHFQCFEPSECPEMLIFRQGSAFMFGGDMRPKIVSPHRRHALRTERTWNRDVGTRSCRFGCRGSRIANSLHVRATFRGILIDL